MIRATTACNFSSLIWPAASAPAALASLLFRPSGAPNHWKKHSVSRLSYLFPHLHLLSSDSFSSLVLLSSTLSLPPPCSAFHLSHIVGSLTSKLPSVTFFQLRIVCLSFPWKKARAGDGSRFKMLQARGSN